MDELEALFSKVMSKQEPKKVPIEQEKLDFFPDEHTPPALILDFKTPRRAPVGNKVDALPKELSFSDEYGFFPTHEEAVEEGEKTYKEDRSFQKDVVAFIERYWYEYGELPKYSQLHDTFHDYPECPRYVRNWKTVVDAVFEKLEVRGLPGYRTTENYLDPRFITATHTLLNFRDNRTDAAKLKELGITSRQFDAWLKRKKYYEYYKKYADKVFDEDIQTESKRAITKLIAAGDLSAVKYHDERTGIYRHSDNTVELMGVFMQAILSILARNVSADILNTIGAQIREEPVVQKMLGNIVEVEEHAS